MPNDTTRRIALNIPLIVLWVAAIAVAGLGYWLLQTGNAAQADFYNTQGSDYLQFLNLQTQSTLGGMLLTAGVVGVFIALAIHARNRAAAVLAANATVVAGYYEDELDEDTAFDGTYGDADAHSTAVKAPAVSDTAAGDATGTPAATDARTNTAASAQAAAAAAKPAAVEPTADEPTAAEPAAVEAADVEAADVEPTTPAVDETSADPTDGTTRA
ncbi:MAG: hypothetical protein M3Y52_08220 [Actinomycetota bacterium]|nr:hypothetical protein [Actinomycetota bacterium]